MRTQEGSQHESSAVQAHIYWKRWNNEELWERSGGRSGTIRGSENDRTDKIQYWPHGWLLGDGSIQGRDVRDKFSNHPQSCL